MIETNSLNRVYRTNRGKIHALDDVSISIPEGITALIGSNGSGKSTLIRILCGMEKPSRGSFSIRGREVSGKNLVEYRENIGYVPQDVRFVSQMTCHDALSYAGWVAGMKRHDYVNRIPRVLELVGLEGKERARVGSLSGGQNRRVGIAAALIHKPEILFLDEPTAGLDPHARIEVRNVIGEVGENMTVVFSTHLSDDINSVADHVIAMHKGHAAMEGTWDLLLRASDHGSDRQIGDGIERVISHIASVERVGK